MGKREHHDVVVVGSGFGGAVAAYRLAEAGRSVVVLERGMAFAPGDFPRSPAEMSRAFWDPEAGRYGVFDVWSFKGCDSIVSSGLGGGSLIYSNVLMRKDERWFVEDEPLPDGGYESWPVTRAELDPHYDAVERMLGGTPYPLDKDPYAETLKTRAMQDAAAELGLDWDLPLLAVNFAGTKGGPPEIGVQVDAPAYGNLHGVPRRTCRLCGECNLGCNDGAKNSLDHTYLSAARHHGAELRTGHEVRTIRPREGGGYEIGYTRHEPGAPAAEGFITCDRLVLAAGAFGTSYLLLRNRDDLPALSEALGTRFSGNGDLLTFLLRATDRNGTRPIKASHGPVITSSIRLADERDGGPPGARGAYIQDGGYPGFVDWIAEAVDMKSSLARAAGFVIDLFKAHITRDNNLSDEIAGLIGDGSLSGGSLPLLAMGRDIPDGVLRLKGDTLEVNWTTKTSEEYFSQTRGAMRRMADVLGAEYKDNPMWFSKRIITVHPMGGAPMGRHPGAGVCDPYGEVYGHPGLYIADGAAMPGPVGPNPSLTIAAMADRMATMIVDGARSTGSAQTGGDRAGGPGNRPRGPQAASAATGPADGGGSDAACGRAGRTPLSFSEKMTGFITPGTTDPVSGETTGRQNGDRLSFRLTITIDDIDEFLDDPDRLARAEGSLDAGICGGERPVDQGWFNLFAPSDDPDDREVRYRLHFTNGAALPRTLIGWKSVTSGPPTRLWLDSSTLYVQILKGHVAEDDDAPVIGAGVLRISPAELARSITSFRADGPGGSAALARFGRFFLGQLWEVYGL